MRCTSLLVVVGGIGVDADGGGTRGATCGVVVGAAINGLLRARAACGTARHTRCTCSMLHPHTDTHTR